MNATTTKYITRLIEQGGIKKLLDAYTNFEEIADYYAIGMSFEDFLNEALTEKELDLFFEVFTSSSDAAIEVKHWLLANEMNDNTSFHAGLKKAIEHGMIVCVNSEGFQDQQSIGNVGGVQVFNITPKKMRELLNTAEEDIEILEEMMEDHFKVITDGDTSMFLRTPMKV